MKPIFTPLMLDASYWERIPDWAKVSPRPMFVATKATEGSTYIDPTFRTYWADLKQDGIYRSAYHFFRKAVTAASQALNYVTLLRSVGVDSKDILELDIEEDGTTATQIIAWLDVVEKQFSNQIMIYSRANILNAIAMTATQRERLKKYPIWTAGYPTNPALFTDPPQIYRPDATKWGRVWAWQYSEDGQVDGVEGEIDLNWMSPELVGYLTGAINMTSYGKVNTSVLNIRSGAGASYEDIGDLKLNDTVEASEIRGGWWRLTKVNGAATTRESWASGTYITPTAAPVTPPPVDLTELTTKVTQIAGTLANVLQHVAVIDQLQADVNDIKNRSNDHMLNLALVKADTENILTILDADNPTVPPPPVVDLGYSGPVVGDYELLDDNSGTRWVGMEDSFSNDTTQMSYETARYLRETYPQAWEYFTDNKAGEPVITYTLTKTGEKLWHIKLRLYPGPIRIAEINKVKNTGRVIGFGIGASYKPSISVTNPQPKSIAPWLWGDIPTMPHDYPYVQPWQNPNRPEIINAVWVDMGKLRKLS